MRTPASFESDRYREVVDGAVDYVLIPKPNEQPGHPLFEQFDGIRTRWVCNIYKWLPANGSDIDRLDTDTETVSIGVTVGERDEAKLLGGMRITPIKDLSKSLSWEMVETTFKGRSLEVLERLHEQDRFSQALANGRVFDITRAFPNPAIPKKAEEIVLHIFGAGTRYCDELLQDPDGDYFWLLTLNKVLEDFLAKHDIPYMEIAEDTAEANEWTRTRVVLVDLAAAHRHIVHETPDHPSHQILLEALFDEREWS